MRRYYNGPKTALLLGLLTAIVLTAGYWLGGGPGLVLAAALSLAVNGAAYFWSDTLALRAMAARPVSEIQAPALHAIVRDLATAAAGRSACRALAPHDRQPARRRRRGGPAQARSRVAPGRPVERR